MKLQLTYRKSFNCGTEIIGWCSLNRMLHFILFGTLENVLAQLALHFESSTGFISRGPRGAFAPPPL